MSEPKIIYLGPACEVGTGDGRTWAEDNPWPDCECGHRPVQYVLGETFDRVVAERDALQLRLNAADQRSDELTQRKAEPVEWGAPKSVRQLIRQLETLDQELRPLSMLRVPGEVFEDGKERTRAVHLSFSHERVEGQWLAPFKGDGEKVLAFWCRMEKDAALSFEFEHPSSKEKRTVTLTKRDVLDGMEDYFYDKLGEQICQCESVGETNVVDCNCDEYVHDFEIVNACLDATSALNAPK
ncbi:hypothetical protein PS712_05777 [Pseudomonas fluorescens]|uniref:Uncharacterized protein n=1 Tax=Pseudomonas fluorescens TaxID=294 RepID=A0A5E7FLQ7_PSEFL|nr:hypothetical protein [Pseudomonas fluorescens]VVO40190.1 hypothetical protein PS712_05777 [Pseudomonas fluorescens]